MVKVNNPRGIGRSESGKIVDTEYVKANLSKGFTHKANTKGLKPKRKGLR